MRRPAAAAARARAVLTLVRRHWGAFLGLAAALAFIGTGLYASTCGFAGCPSTARILSFRPSEGSQVLDRSGRLLGRLTYVRRVNVPLSRVPRQLQRAFIAVEDRRFYRHDGVDWRGAARAAWRNLAHFDVEEGFSTITMQVVRNAFLADRAQERTLRRKLIEIVLARRLERHLPKDRILDLYLNLIYLGNGDYGVEAASRDYFGKGVGQLSLAEAATLAALPKAPTSYNPRRFPERAEARRNLVLGLMADQGFVTPEQAERAAAEPLEVSDDGWAPRTEQSSALDAVRSLVDSVLGDRADGPGDLVVRTTLDARAQRAAERAVQAQARAIADRNGEGDGSGPVQGAMVALDPRSGAIRAVVGASRYDRGGFNRAFGARRQPGSAFKPFVYAAALAAGLSPATVLDDEPIEVTMDGGRIWRPANYGDEYAGPVTMRRALMLSANAATVRLAVAVGNPRIIAVAHRAGVETTLPDVPALALGAVEVTPLELVTGYAAFANGGRRVHPWLVSRIETPDGRVLWRRDSTPPEPALDPREAFQMTSMLRSVVDGGTGSALRALGVRGPVAGKTGTTNEGNDVWFVGYTPTVVAGFWFGYDSARSLGPGATGGRLAAPAWAAFYRNGWREDDGRGWTPPPGLVERTIDATNGMLATQWCPITEQEWFEAGTEPTQTCTEHQGTLWDGLSDLGAAIGRAVRRALGL